jgi:hypothetical protein
MSQSSGVRWYCMDRNCQFAFIATIALESDETPRCLCGKAMKKEEPVEVFRYLDFLREDSAGKHQASAGKE